MVESYSPENEFIRIHFQLNQEHIDLLKRIDPDSQSKALRIILDRYMKQTKLLSFEKYLPISAVGLVLIVIGTILPNVLVSLTSIFTGAFLIGYSIFMYNRGRIKYEEEK